MDAKLTLSLNKKIIDQAKKYARKNNISLSKLIENYLGKVSAVEKEEPKITPLVKSLSGLVDAAGLDDREKGYTDYLAKKYNR